MFTFLGLLDFPELDSKLQQLTQGTEETHKH